MKNARTDHLPWIPDRDRLQPPVYRAIARALEEDVAAGVLHPHDQLPPQREMARALELNLTTITRAYKLMEEKGLIYAGTGRGTFVAPSMGGEAATGRKSEGLIELGMIRPFYQCNALVMQAARKVTARSRTVQLLEYTGALGTPWQQEAACRWMKFQGMQANPRDVLMASGSQNALAVALSALFQPGQMIAADPYTYANFKGLCAMVGVGLIPIHGDEMGMCPGALDEACARQGVKGVYLMPALSNPMGVVMPPERRQQLAKVIEKWGLIAIEDDVYGFLHSPALVPMAAILPERTLHICGTSKSLCAGLRVAFVVAPPVLRSRVEEGMLSINLNTAALNAEIICELIESGLAWQIVEQKAALARQRNSIFEEIFAPLPPCAIAPFFRWMALPDGVSSQEFERLARQRGVNLLGGHRFRIGEGDGKEYIRLALTSPDDEEQLARGLRIVKELMNEGRPQREYIV